MCPLLISASFIPPLNSYLVIACPSLSQNERHIATSVELASNRTAFYGKDLNHVRGWYFWLRRQLGLKKAVDTIKKIGDHQKRIANNIIYKITREIVNRAIETDSLIVLGKLKGLRNREKKEGRGRGRKFNGKLSGFPYFKFTEYLTYKAALAGIKVIKIFENWTSQTCRKCNQRGTRRTQGLFVCKTCGERMLIEMLLLISLTGLWDTFPK
jgi:putative transposase